MKIFKKYEPNRERTKLDHIRFDFKWFGFGAFLRYGNYCKGKGIEFHSNMYRTCPWILGPFLGWHIGWTKTTFKRKIIRWSWSGSMVKPFTGWTFSIGRFGFGHNSTPKFIQKLIQKYSDWKWNRSARKFWEEYPKEELFWNDLEEKL